MHAGCCKGLFSPFISSSSSSRRTSLGTLGYQAPRDFEMYNVTATLSTRYLPASSGVCCCQKLRLLQEGDVCFSVNYSGSAVSARAVTHGLSGFPSPCHYLHRKARFRGMEALPLVAAGTHKHTPTWLLLLIFFKFIYLLIEQTSFLLCFFQVTISKCVVSGWEPPDTTHF